MIELFKGRAPVPQPLGPLEINVMELLWARGESNVHHVVDQLSRPLAYTTVMTTLDRLFKKGLLKRRKVDRAFLYSAKSRPPELPRALTAPLRCAASGPVGPSADPSIAGQSRPDQMEL